jgi:hypothetical protein
MDRAKVLLPVTTREKRPLLRFGLRGPGGGPVHLLPRSSIAALEAEALHQLVDSSDGGESVRRGLPAELLEAICVFTPALYDSFLKEHGGFGKKRKLRALHAYLEDGLGLPSLTLRHVEELLSDSDAATAVLEAWREESADPRSSAECVLLALPHIDPRPADAQEVADIVARYRTGVEAASNRKTDRCCGGCFDTAAGGR